MNIKRLVLEGMRQMAAKGGRASGKSKRRGDSEYYRQLAKRRSKKRLTEALAHGYKPRKRKKISAARRGRKKKQSK